MDTQQVPQPDPQGEQARKPYARPAVHWEENFEPYVYSTCAKMPGQGQPCASNKNS